MALKRRRIYSFNAFLLSRNKIILFVCGDNRLLFLIWQYCEAHGQMITCVMHSAGAAVSFSAKSQFTDFCALAGQIKVRFLRQKQ